MKSSDLFANIPHDITRQLPDEYQSIDNSLMVEDTLNYSLKQLGGYFHKYFPRSYIETDTLLSYLLKHSSKYKTVLSKKEQFSILDIGCGIGANTFALAKNLASNFPNIRLMKIDAVDGNTNALEYQQALIKKLVFRCDVKINPIHKIFTHGSLIPDLGQLCKSNNNKYDIIISSKFLNEFYRKSPDIVGLYTQLIHWSHDILDQSGILIITELTDKISDKRHYPVSRYLNKVFNQETRTYFYKYKKHLKHIFPLPCYMWRDICEDANKCYIQNKYLDGAFKAFSQIFCFKTFGRNFYNSSYIDKWGVRPIRVNSASIQNRETFCYQGKLFDDNQITPEFHY